MAKKISLSQDARGNYRRVIGKRASGTEATFYLGRDPHAAALQVMNLEKAWEQCKPAWDETAYEIAKSIGLGKPVALVTHPCASDLHMLPVDAKAVCVQKWLDELRRKFPCIQIELANVQMRESVASAIGHKLDQAKDTVKQLAQLTDAHDRKLEEALAAFRAHLGRAHVRPEGGITTFGITAQKRVDALVEHLGKLGLAKTPLNKVNATFIEEWLVYWKSRPVTKRTGKMCSVNWVRDVVKILREFIRWLNASSEFEWRKPVDYEVRPLRIRRTNEEKARRLVPKYTREQLGILWEYASPIERVYMILGLNCGFGAGEINTLRLDEIKQSKDKDGSIKHRICHTRTKTGVYGEWSLWPETVAAIEWYRNKLRPTSTSPYLFLTRNGTPLALPSENGNRNLAIQNAWKRLTERIRKVDHPGFPEMSFNKLRKTSSNYVRRKYSDEVADMFLCHGKLEMVDAYTDRPFAKVHKAVRRLQKLLSSVLVPVAWPEDSRKTNPSLSRGQIKRIVELRGQGYRINKIAEVTNITRDTVRKYLKRASASEPAK